MNNNDIRAYRILRKLKFVSLVNVAIILKDSGINGLIKKLKEKFNINTKHKEKKYNFKNGYINVVFQNPKLYNNYKNAFEKYKYKYNFFVVTNESNSKNYQSLELCELNKNFSERSFIYVTQKNVNLSLYRACFIINPISIDNELENIFNSYKLLKLLANYENKNNITAKAATFFNYEGFNYYSGGAERYLLDLYDVCKNLNINMDIYQNATKPFMKKFRNINVIGICNNDYEINYSHAFFDSQMEKYINMTKGKSQLHIFSAFYECYPKKCSPSIGISHGISWDNPYSKAVDGIDFWNSKLMFIESAKNCDKLVSVDTNTANWFQTVDYDLGNKKTKLITNYVDVKEFYPDNSFKKPGKIVITYPRRLYEPRGMYLLLDIVDDLFKKYKNIEIHFVGKGFKEDTDKIQEKIKKYPKRLFCYNKTPEEMHEVYKMSDISLVPTLYSEGTSLSCLEAMASGNIVICTRIGGLTDLVINGLNGYLIEPNKESLLTTLEEVINNIDSQSKIQKNAIATAKALNKEIWSKKWTEEIESFNLKHKSENIGLVEFYLKDANHLTLDVIDLIKKEILNNNLVYIRSEKEVKNDYLSYGLLQLVDINEEIVSEANKIYIESGLNVDRSEKMELIK